MCIGRVLFNQSTGAVSGTNGGAPYVCIPSVFMWERKNDVIYTSNKCTMYSVKQCDTYIQTISVYCEQRAMNFLSHVHVALVWRPVRCKFFWYHNSMMHISYFVSNNWTEHLWSWVWCLVPEYLSLKLVLNNIQLMLNCASGDCVVLKKLQCFYNINIINYYTCEWM